MKDILCLDILNRVFSYLSTKDIISCSRVNHKWYIVSSNNYLWFIKFKKECEKYIKHSEHINYDDKLNYKLYYLSLFNQKYHLQITDFYRDIINLANVEHLNLIQKSVAYVFFISPIVVFSFPFLFGSEIYDYINHRKHSYEYCNCGSCFRGLNSKRRIYAYIHKIHENNQDHIQKTKISFIT